MNILSRICDIRPRVKYMMSRIRDNRPMSVKVPFSRLSQNVTSWHVDILSTIVAFRSSHNITLDEVEGLISSNFTP